MVDKRGLQIPSKKSELTPVEKEVLRLITEEFLSLKQIQIRRNCSRQAVYKIVKKLREKSFLTVTNQKVDGSLGTHIPKGKIRLHGQEFNIKILWQDQFYQKNLRNSNILYLDGNLIKLYRNSVEIYSSQSFFGVNETEADSKALEYYWKRLIRRLENDLKVVLMKDRVRNMKEVKHEYAHTDSEIYENARQHRERIMVYAEEDGRLAFITDDSFGFKEDETVHPETAKYDRKVIDKQINDWRLRDPPTNSELAMNLNKLIQVTHQDMAMRAEYSRDIVEHKEAIKSLGHAVGQMTRTIKGVVKENQDLKLKLKGQTKLGDFFNG